MSVMNDDASDLPAAVAGDAEAFVRLYDQYAPVVLSLCRRRAWSASEAEDLLQEVFLRAYSKLHEVANAEKLAPWLYGMARRVCDERRRATRRRLRHEWKASTIRMEQHPPVPTPPDNAEHAERLERLTAAIEALPDSQRLAVHLYYLESKPVEAARQVLRLSRQGFYKRLAKARVRLATLMCEGTPP
jgi:RNA polymerase sigma-70 factor (ECF subfamily)